MVVDHILSLLKQQLDGSYKLACFYREAVPDNADLLSSLIKATTVLVKDHWAKLCKEFTPMFAFELIERKDDTFDVQLRVSNGLIDCSKSLLLTLNKDGEIVSMETNYNY